MRNEHKAKGYITYTLDNCELSKDVDAIHNNFMLVSTPTMPGLAIINTPSTTQGSNLGGSPNLRGNPAGNSSQQRWNSNTDARIAAMQANMDISRPIAS